MIALLPNVMLCFVPFLFPILIPTPASELSTAIP